MGDSGTPSDICFPCIQMWSITWYTFIDEYVNDFVCVWYGMYAIGNKAVQDGEGLDTYPHLPTGNSPVNYIYITISSIYKYIKNLYVHGLSIYLPLLAILAIIPLEASWPLSKPQFYANLIYFLCKGRRLIWLKQCVSPGQSFNVNFSQCCPSQAITLPSTSSIVIPSHCLPSSFIPHFPIHFSSSIPTFINHTARTWKEAFISIFPFSYLNFFSVIHFK